MHHTGLWNIHDWNCQKCGRTPSKDRHADTLTHTHTRTHTQLRSSGCEFASSQLVLSCLIGWNRDRDEDEERRKEGGKLGKCLQWKALVRLGKLYQTLATHYTVSFGCTGNFPSPSPVNYRTHLFICLRRLFLIDLPFVSKVHIMTVRDYALWVWVLIFFLSQFA